MQVHKTAIVHQSTFDRLVDRDITIGPYCVIEEDVDIGDGTVLRAFVELRKGTVIGEKCYLDSGVKMSGNCVLGNRVIVRYDSIIARGCRVEDNTFISPQCMTINLEHNGKEIGGAHIGKRCHLGTQAVLHPGITLADDVIIGAKALVTKDCALSGIYIGIPARRRP